MPRNRAKLEAHIKANPVKGGPRQMRDAFEALSCAKTPPKIVDFGGVPCGVFGQGAPVVWFHGGGYVFGSSSSHATMADTLASITNRQVIVPDYRLAPEHRWPAPLEDALAVYHAFGGAVPVMGDSAGGHLALNVALNTDVPPIALALISPNTDRTGLSTTRAANSAKDLMNNDEDDADLAAMVFGDYANDHPQVSPILTDLKGLPPTYITASRIEVLFGDACLLHARLRKAQVDTEFEIVDDLFHMWPLWPNATSQATKTLSQIARFLTVG